MGRKAGGKKKKASSPPIAGRYRVVRSLGKGGTGAVYLVQDQRSGGQAIALKLVKEKWREAIVDLKNEFATLSLLRHQNLAGVYDFGVAEQGLYFTSEWIDGKDILAATLHADLNTVFQLLVQILRALDFLHQRGVLHLDLKPANILVTDPNRTGELTVKLIDFGIAQWKKRGQVREQGFSGSPPYAAPELLQEKEPGPASDIYSLGMLCHQIFAGRFPFPTQNPVEILMRQTFEDPQRLQQLDAALPPEFADLLHRMVAREPGSRLQNSREVLAALNRSLGENFSLRGRQAPAHPIEESDHLFHPELLQALLSRVSSHGRVELVGPPGAGKTRLVERLKARLQLQGLRPLHFRDASDWDAFRGRPGAAQDRIILLDLPVPPPFPAEEAAAILWTSRIPTPPGDWEESMRIPELDEAKLSHFFKTEIQGAPMEVVPALLNSYGSIFPGRLEELLQAMREEGILTWGQGGWNWQAEVSVDLGSLLERKASREQQRKKAVQEFLQGSGLALTAPVLEGMLGYEPGALGDALRNWTQEGWIQCEMQKGIAYYSSKALKSEPSAGNLEDDAALARQLNALYDQGRFEAGAAWLEQIIKRRGRESIPPPLALIGARLLVAAGAAAKAEEMLKGLRFADAATQGLLDETRARVHNALGHFAAVKAELADSEINFEAAGSKWGLARVANLRGNTHRAEGQWEEAEAEFRRAVQLGSEAGDLYCAGIAQTNLALVLQEQGKIEAAYAAYQLAWSFARSNPHPFLIQSLYNNWIGLLYHAGKTAEAEAACYEWLKLAIPYGYREQQAIALNYLSLLAGKKSHLELKKSFLDQAIALLEGGGNPRFLAQFLVNRAYLHWSQGRYLSAQLDGEAALRLRKLRPNDRVLGFVYLILGKIYRDRPKLDLKKSAEFFGNALDNILKNQNRQSLWEIHYNLGLLAKKLGDIPQAREYFLKSKRALEDFMGSMPHELRASYLRDRKLETVTQELNALDAGRQA